MEYCWKRKIFFVVISLRNIELKILLLSNGGIVGAQTKVSIVLTLNKLFDLIIFFANNCFVRTSKLKKKY